MPKQYQKAEVRVFNTVEVVALYMGKTFDHRQMKEIKKIVDFLIGKGDSFTYEDTSRLLKIQQILVKQFPWLRSVKYNRTEIQSKIDNLIQNHGLTLKVEKIEL